MYDSHSRFCEGSSILYTEVAFKFFVHPCCKHQVGLLIAVFKGEVHGNANDAMACVIIHKLWIFNKRLITFVQ